MSEPIKGWTWHDLDSKIDSEGGSDYFFRHWCSPDSITDPRLKELAERFVEAADALDAYWQAERDKEPDPEPEDYEEEDSEE